MPSSINPSTIKTTMMNANLEPLRSTDKVKSNGLRPKQKKRNRIAKKKTPIKMPMGYFRKKSQRKIRKLIDELT